MQASETTNDGAQKPTVSLFKERMSACKGKQIHVFENGEAINRGLKIYINPHHFHTWNSLLKHITEVLRPKFGAVRSLVTRNGKQNICSLLEVKANDKYVACGHEKYKKIKGG